MTAKPDKKRLFFAIWPNAKILKQLEQTRKRYCPHGGRWTPVENLHVTLVFLGNIETQRIASVEYAASQIEAKAFEMQLDNLRTAPAKGMVWLSPTNAPQEMSDLVDSLKSALIAQDFEIERRAFRAHVTLIRKLHQRIEKQQIKPVHWPVESFALIESRQSHGASEYTRIGSWRLHA